LLDLLLFAFIQRGSVLFWMHVRPKNERTLHRWRRQQNHLPGKQEPLSALLFGSPRLRVRRCDFLIRPAVDVQPQTTQLLPP
jgi:hypothetical protein